MESLDNVQENAKKDTIVKTGSDMLISKTSLIKTKYDKGKHRDFYKTNTTNEETSPNLDSPFSSSEEGNENKKSLKNPSWTSIEIRRLEEINGRSTRLVFNNISELPNIQDIMDICLDILIIVEAKFRAPSCFCIFKDKKRKDLAEKLLDGLRFRSGYISVDSHRKMVPVDTHDIETSREMNTLAVHGIPRQVTVDDLRRTFPGAKNVKIAHRGGSAFLTYTDSKTCSEAFIEAEDIRVGGYRVQVLFGHVISKNGNRDKMSNRISIESPFPNNNSIFSERSPIKVVTKTEFKTPAKPHFKSLLSALDGSGLKMDELQADYMRGVCEPGSGPDIRTAWIDCLKANTDNKLSRSSRMDLVDNVWNFFEDDLDTQQRLKTEKKNLVKKAARRIIRQEKGSSPERKRQRSWDEEICKKRDKRKVYFSPHEKDIRMSSLKHCRREIKYDSPSPSPPRVKSDIVEKEMDEKDRTIETKKESLSPKTKRTHGSNNLEDGAKASLLGQGHTLTKQSKKFKKGRVLALESDIRESRNNSKMMMTKLREKAVDSKTGIEVTDKVLKQYKEVEEKVKIKQKEKNKSEKEETLKIFRTVEEKEEYNLLKNHIKTELELNGLKTNASSTVDLIIDSFLQQGLSYSGLEQDYLRHFTRSTHSGKLRERLASLLSGAGFSNSSEISPNLAAGLSLEFFHSNLTTQTKLAKWRQSSVIIDKKLEELAEEEPINKSVKGTSVGSSGSPIPRKSILHNVLEVSGGFSRMALVMAGRLADQKQMEEEKCKDMAAEMVAVWINYGITYDDLADLYANQRKRDLEANSDDASFAGMRKLLHSRLRKKVEEGHLKPKKFGFTMLIDATMSYFERNT